MLLEIVIEVVDFFPDPRLGSATLLHCVAFVVFGCPDEADGPAQLVVGFCGWHDRGVQVRFQFHLLGGFFDGIFEDLESA